MRYLFIILLSIFATTIFANEAQTLYEKKVDLGFSLIENNNLEEADKVFQYLINLNNKDEVDFDFSIYNTFGWIAFSRGDFYGALERFKSAQEKDIYSKLSSYAKGKLHNNMGYTYMLLEQYQKSLIEFKKAMKFGNDKAEKGIAKVNSILEVLKSKNMHLPGIFAPVVGSPKSIKKIPYQKEQIMKKLKKIFDNEEFKKLKVDNKELQVYKVDKNRFSITFGNNYSYVKAMKITKIIRKNAIKDAYVSSTSTWSILFK